MSVIIKILLSGMQTQHGAVASLASSSYYQQQNDQNSPAKYPENGHDTTLNDFVTFVCQEAENTQPNQVW